MFNIKFVNKCHITLTPLIIKLKLNLLIKNLIYTIHSQGYDIKHQRN